MALPTAISIGQIKVWFGGTINTIRQFSIPGIQEHVAKKSLRPGFNVVVFADRKSKKDR